MDHFDGCETGEAVITPGFGLRAEHVVHTVGPVYDDHPEPESALRSCYRNSLTLADDEGLESISFCAISTGIFGYPTRGAAQVAMEEIRKFLSDNPGLVEVRMVLLGDNDYQTFGAVAEECLSDN